METVLITGANRGIGLEFARQYAEAGATVIACVRAPDAASELQALQAAHPEKMEIVALDVADPESFTRLSERFADARIDILISNAGVGGGTLQDPKTIDYEAWEQTFVINTMATMRLTEALFEPLRKSPTPRIVAVSSSLGSIADNTSGGKVIYRSSKAALNQVMKCLAEDLNPHGIVAVPVHPGWVRTDMGGPHAILTARESVDGLKRLIGNLTLTESGRFWNWDGKELPW